MMITEQLFTHTKKLFLSQLLKKITLAFMIVFLTVSPLFLSINLSISHHFMLQDLKNISIPSYKIVKLPANQSLANFVSFIIKLNTALTRRKMNIPLRNITFYNNSKYMRVTSLYERFSDNTILRIAITDSGIGLFSINTVENHIFKPLNVSFAKVLEEALMDNLNGNISISVVYEGIHASKMIYTDNISNITQRYGRDIYVVNRTDHYIVYVHPYEKYRVIINGVRVHYPVIVKGVNGSIMGFRIKYLLIANPFILGRAYRVVNITITDNTISRIADLYNYALALLLYPEQDYTPSNITVHDMFYRLWLYNGSYYYTPWIVVSGIDNTVYQWLNILPNGTPLFIFAGELMGPYKPYDSYINLTEIFTPYNGTETNTGSNNSSNTGGNGTGGNNANTGTPQNGEGQEQNETSINTRQSNNDNPIPGSGAINNNNSSNGSANNNVKGLGETSEAGPVANNYKETSTPAPKPNNKNNTPVETSGFKEGNKSNGYYEQLIILTISVAIGLLIGLKRKYR